ncbi:MAG TPA: hypothetical protein VGX76_08585 [Pirellulales bacterium]|jgi:hypothetical protein|nr:hypothetical protein [Pirellulales bacterium]
MWLFTRHGFYSVVCARKGDGSQGQPVDTSRVMVRARVRAHLESLINRFPQLRGQQVHETRGTDYRYRLLVSKSVWSSVVAELANDIRYDNFKNAAAGEPGSLDYSHALGDVWDTMKGLQPE